MSSAWSTPRASPSRARGPGARYPGHLDRGNNDLWGSQTRVAIDPKGPKTVTFFHRSRKLAAALVVKPEDLGERSVTLQPCAVLSGRLVDASGQAVAGVVSIQPTGTDDLPSGLPKFEVVAGDDGRFRIEGLPPTFLYTIRVKDRIEDADPAPPKRFKNFDIARGMAFEAGRPFDFGTFNVQLGKRVEAAAKGLGAVDVPINGRVVDLEGRPVAGVSVKVESAQSPKSGDLSSWIAAVKKGEPAWTAYQHASGSTEIPKGARLQAITDGDGRFRLEGVGAERRATLRLAGDSIAAEDVEVVTRKIEPFEAKGFPSTFGPGIQTIYGADFTLTARPGRVVEGVVIDSKTREPMAGVVVQSEHFSGSDFGAVSILKTTTDARGKFRLVGLPKGKGNKVMAVPNDDQPYFQHEADIANPPGLGPVPLEIALNRGIWITGKVTAKATGRAPSGVRLHYLPFLENKHAQALPEFGNTYSVHGRQDRYLSQPDGSFKLVGLPGRAVVGVDNCDQGYRNGAGYEAFAKEDRDERGNLKTWGNPIHPGPSWPTSMKEINPPAGVEQVSVDLQLDPGLSFRIQVVDPEGRPVSGVTLECSGGDRVRGEFPGPEITVEHFAPGERQNLIVRHEGRKLARVVRIGPGDDANGPVVVKLAPTARIQGRTVDAGGHPIPATKVRPDVLPGGDFALKLPEVVTDAEGRFEVLGVPTGCDYEMTAMTGPMLKDFRMASSRANVKPGETTDVGDLRFPND